MTTFVLVASPLVGPGCWRWVAGELESRGHTVVVPDLAPSDAAAPVWRAHVDCISAEVPAGDVVLVGHSAAGRLVPLVADGRAGASTCVFADAQLPVDLLAPEPDDWFLAHVRSIAHDGELPPWSEWWGDGAWEALVPDPARRAELTAALPRVTVASVAEAPPAPRRPVARGAYVQFSAVYDRELGVARDAGWPVRHLDGQHVHMAVAEAEVADALVEVAAAADPAA